MTAKVRANKGAAGVDGQSIERFTAKTEDYLAELSAALREDTYQPPTVKRVDIPKGDGKTRPRPCGAWLRHDAFRPRTLDLGSSTVPSSRPSGSSLNQFLSMGSRREVQLAPAKSARRREPGAFVRDADAMTRCAEGARFQHDARGRWPDQGRLHRRVEDGQERCGWWMPTCRPILIRFRMIC